MAPTCTVSGCSGRGPNGEIMKRFRYPRDTTLREQWMYLCGNNDKPPIMEGRVCERHFSPKQLICDLNTPLPRGKRFLKPEAVPDINLPVPVIKHEITVKHKDTTMSPSLKKCVPLSVKLKILDDQERGFGPKLIQKKYKVKKSTYYRIISEKEMIRDYVERGGSVEFESKPEKDDDDHEVDALENSDHKDKDDSDDDDDKDSNHSGSSGVRGMRVLRIQDQITAFQRLQAGETAGQIATDLGVSRQTIQRVKKRLKDTLFTPTTDQKYHIKVEKTKYKSESAVNEDLDSVTNNESVLAAIERRKQLKLNNVPIPKLEQSLSSNEQVAALAQCKAGVPLNQIARNFGVSSSTIQRLKKKHSKSHQLQFKNYMRLDQKVRILERLEEGETIIEIAQDLGVHDTTIRGIKKSRTKIMSLYRAGWRPSTESSKVSKVNGKHDNMERKLLEWINNLQRWKIPMSNAMIQKKAILLQMHMAQEEGGSSSQSFLPTKEWLTDFKRRNNIQKLSQEESGSESELDEPRYSRAAPKCKKKYFAAPRKSDILARASQDTPLFHTEIMPLSKFAEGLREMLLSKSLPANPNRCNAFTPRVILSSVEPTLIEKHSVPDIVKTEPPSDEETWLTAHTNVGSDSDWTEQNWDANSLTEAPSRSSDSSRKKRRNSGTEFSRKRRKVVEDESDEDGSVADHSRNNYMNIPIKQEPQSSVDSISPNVPMAVLPAGSTYVPPLPMFQMPTTGLAMFMPESQHMMMQHAVNYPHDNTGDMFMNQQQLRGRTIDTNASSQFNDIHSEVNVEPSIREDGERETVMPYEKNIHESEKSKQLPSSEPDSVSEALAEKARRERAAAIAENIGIGIGVEGSSNKKLRDLTFKLLELNNKNLLCDDRIEKAKEEYEKTVAEQEAEKRINDKEIDKVLSAIQEWKAAKGNTTV